MTQSKSSRSNAAANTESEPSDVPGSVGIGWWNIAFLTLFGVMFTSASVATVLRGDGFEIAGIAVAIAFVGALLFVVNGVVLLVCMAWASPGSAASTASLLLTGMSVYKNRTFGPRATTAAKMCLIGLVTVVVATTVFLLTADGP